MRSEGRNRPGLARDEHVLPDPDGIDRVRAGGLYEGDEIRERLRGLGEIGAFLAAADARKGGAQILPILRASAIPGGRVTSEPLGYVGQAWRAGRT